MCRLFWSDDDRFLKQFKAGDLKAKFKSYSKYPPCFKDMAFWISPEFTENHLCELVRGECYISGVWDHLSSTASSCSLPGHGLLPALRVLPFGLLQMFAFCPAKGSGSAISPQSTDNKLCNESEVIIAYFRFKSRSHTSYLPCCHYITFWISLELAGNNLIGAETSSSKSHSQQ